MIFPCDNLKSISFGLLAEMPFRVSSRGIVAERAKGFHSATMITEKDKQRFWNKVEKRPDSDCWWWTGAQNKPRPTRPARADFYFNKKIVKASQMSWALSRGEWPTLFTLHHCDNPLCVNPFHLFQGTNADNMRDMANKGRSANQKKTHCANGHPFSPDNTAFYRNGTRRFCRTCQKIAWAKYRRKRRKPNAASE